MKQFLEIEPEYSSFDNSKVVIIPAGYEKTTTYGKGTKNGPNAILAASQIVEDYDVELGCEPYKKLGIHTLPEMKFSKDAHKDIYDVTKMLLQKDKVPFLLGGEHSISYGAVKAAKELHPNLCVLQFDAHADLRNSYHGSKHNHACIMRRIRELCPAVQVGVRSQDIEETEYLQSTGNSESVFYAHDFDETKIHSIVHMLGPYVYITFDVDAFDPSIIPATGTPETGGLLWYPVMKLLREVFTKKTVVAMDVVEVSPKKGLEYSDYAAAKLVYKMIGYLTKRQC